MDVSTTLNPQMSTLHSDALCGSCTPSGSAPQPNGLWPSLPQSGPGFPTWSGQAVQSAPCWPGQPSSPCWPGTQTAPVSVPAPISVPAPAQAVTPAPALTTTMVPAPAPVQAPAPAPVQPCQPCWPGTQYQPLQPPAPMQAQVPYQTPTQVPYQTPTQVPYQVPAQVPAQVPVQVPTQVPAQLPVPTGPAASMHPNVPGWPAHPGWPYNPGQSGWPGQNPSIIPPHWLPPTSGPLSVPYNLNLARGVYDKMMMTILAQVKPNAKMFTINFLRGNDIAFHINPRFNDGGKQVVVRNHKVGERWGAEERDLKGPFPFALGSPFEMKILCTPETFRVAVNNIPLFEFRHRVRELNQIDRINILHDVVLTFVNVETLP
ncbi:galectin-3 isoform X2 [Betta splendens]|uniref:Galectin n=1 Tax=Betta splendens TaxID=158456 RepID=A0A6P7LRV6_BETSP|nr:galectin-3 isoform X2 [Betta splendens]